jgi:hypothetical protein
MSCSCKKAMTFPLLIRVIFQEIMVHFMHQQLLK